MVKFVASSYPGLGYSKGSLCLSRATNKKKKARIPWMGKVNTKLPVVSSFVVLWKCKISPLSYDLNHSCET